MTTITWFAIETRPRGEYAALHDLQTMTDLDIYLPQEIRQRRTRKGKEKVRHPLMPGILFVGCIDPADIWAATRSGAVRRIIRSATGEALPIRPQVIDGWRVNIVDHLRAREAAGDFDFTPRQKAPRKPGFLKGTFRDQLAAVRNALFEQTDALETA